MQFQIEHNGLQAQNRKAAPRNQKRQEIRFRHQLQSVEEAVYLESDPPLREEERRVVQEEVQ